MRTFLQVILGAEQCTRRPAPKLSGWIGRVRRARGETLRPLPAVINDQALPAFRRRRTTSNNGAPPNSINARLPGSGTGVIVRLAAGPGNQFQAAGGPGHVMRELIDAGMFSNFPGGMKSAKARTSTNEIAPGPGEWVDIEGINLIKLGEPCSGHHPTRTATHQQQMFVAWLAMY
jgi:hypothetical protein